MDNPRETAYLELVKRQRDLIWRVCSDFSLSAAWEVEDAFQEVLLTLWKDFGSYKGLSSERTWVYRVATNTMLMIKRRAINQPQPQVELREEATSDNDHVQQLREIIDSLEETDRCVVCANLDGFSHKEIAQMTGLSSLAVATRLNRIKHKIRQRYEQGF
ncbi:MAG: RNA polymerase sigma factor [Bacteroidales bacterium]|nr:RNA polymerase sigma factor [Bacteroidales bacterium]